MYERTAYTSATPSITGTPIGAITYTLSGTDSALFTVDSGTGVVSMIARDFETPADGGSNNVYDYTLTVTDADGNTDDQLVAVTVTDVVETSAIVIAGLASSCIVYTADSTDDTASVTSRPIGAINENYTATVSDSPAVYIATGAVTWVVSASQA